MEFYKSLSRHVKDISAVELREYFPESSTKSFIMRSIIMNEYQYIHLNYNRTLRAMWYSTVKPTLDKLGLLEESDQTEEGLTKWDAVLSRYVGDLLRRGALTYQDLSIQDISRKKQNPFSYYRTGGSSYSYQVSTAPYPNIIIATEKDTVYQYLQTLAEIFGCSCISSKGQNSLGAMEVLIRGMRTTGDKITILTMTDYDPAGYYIADALYKQAVDICEALGKYSVEISIERIGIEPDQLTPEMVEANKYTPKPANLEKWFYATGGINGEMKGLELDALTPDQIRAIFVEKIQKYIDPDQYVQFVKQAYIESEVLKYMDDHMYKLIEHAKETFEDEVEVKDFDVFEHAKEGNDRIPIRELGSLPDTAEFRSSIDDKIINMFND